MKTRIISGAIGCTLALVVLFLPSIFLNVAMAAVCVLCMYEMLVVTKYINHYGLVTVGMLFAAAAPFLMLPRNRLFLMAVMFVYLLALVIIQLRYHEQLSIKITAFVFFVSLVIPLTLSCIAYMRQHNDYGLFYVFFTFIIAWVTDAGAYFVGTLCGRHKLCPTISPKKTVEGLVGGMVIGVLGCLLAAWIYQLTVLNALGLSVSYWQVAVVALCCAPLSVIGDLFASIIKRQCKVKDFGNLIPGHGGAMDRFDSLLFVAPAVYLLIRLLPMVG